MSSVTVEGAVAKNRTGRWVVAVLTIIVAPLFVVVMFSALFRLLIPGITDTPSSFASNKIPANMLALYESPIVFNECPTLSWTIVAAIIHLESNDGRNNGPSSAGAMGPSQFMPTTWDSQGRTVVDFKDSKGNPLPYGRNPDGLGYALDGDGDAIGDINNPYDSVPATARFLCANGGGNPATLPSAIYSYNHAWWYVYGGLDNNGHKFIGVLPLARKIAAQTSAGLLSPGGIVPPGAPVLGVNGQPVPGVTSSVIDTYVNAALTQVGKPYSWGSESEANGFDCSGLVWWALGQAGINFTRTIAAGEYSLGVPITGSLQKGDLVFWAMDPTDPSTIAHVAIYYGNGLIIAASSSVGQVTVQPMWWQSGGETYIGARRLA